LRKDRIGKEMNGIHAGEGCLVATLISASGDWSETKRDRGSLTCRTTHGENGSWKVKGGRAGRTLLFIAMMVKRGEARYCRAGGKVGSERRRWTTPMVRDLT